MKCLNEFKKDSASQLHLKQYSKILCHIISIEKCVKYKTVEIIKNSLNIKLFHLFALFSNG